MLFRLLGKTVWFSGKMVVKHVLVPIAITAATAVVLEKLVERLDKAPNATAATPRPARPARVNAEA
jgi:predicted PurR-regulated permease PerM